MRYDIFQHNIRALLHQRNILFPICLLLGLSQFVSIIFLFNKKERIVIVPASVDKTFYIESNVVSPTYLEQMGLFFSQLILSKSTESAAKQREVVLRHTLPRFHGSIKEQLIEEEKHLNKEGGSYHFYPVSTEIITGKNIVIITGERISLIGERIVAKEREKYTISFVCQNGRLYISGFSGEKI